MKMKQYREDKKALLFGSIEKINKGTWLKNEDVMKKKKMKKKKENCKPKIKINVIPWSSK